MNIKDLNFSDPAIYDVAAALRGPDLQDRLSQTLKWLLTARIRTMVQSYAGRTQSFKSQYRGMTELSAQAIAEQMDLMDRGQLDALRHYLMHVFSALEVLRIAGVNTEEVQILSDITNTLAAVSTGTKPRDGSGDTCKWLQRNLDLYIAFEAAQGVTDEQQPG